MTTKEDFNAEWSLLQLSLKILYESYRMTVPICAYIFTKVIRKAEAIEHLCSNVHHVHYCLRIKMFVCSFVRMFAFSMFECSTIVTCSNIRMFICSLMLMDVNVRLFESNVR